MNPPWDTTTAQIRSLRHRVDLNQRSSILVIVARKLGRLELVLTTVAPDSQLDEDAKLGAIVSYDCLQQREFAHFMRI